MDFDVKTTFVFCYVDLQFCCIRWWRGPFVWSLQKKIQNLLVKLEHLSFPNYSKFEILKARSENMRIENILRFATPGANVLSLPLIISSGINVLHDLGRRCDVVDAQSWRNTRCLSSDFWIRILLSLNKRITVRFGSSTCWRCNGKEEIGKKFIWLTSNLWQKKTPSCSKTFEKVN